MTASRPRGGLSVRLVFLGFIALIGIAIALSYLTVVGALPGPAATVVTTMILVVLTAFYAFTTYQMVRETRRMAEETKKSRQQEIRPVIEFHAKEVYSAIANIGDGPARNIDLTLELLPAGFSHTVREQSLPAGETIAVPVEPFSSIRDREFLELQEEGLDVDVTEYDDYEAIWDDHDYPYERLQLTGTVADVWGNTHQVDEEFDIWNLTHELRGGTTLTLDAEQSLQAIARELGAIRRSIDDGTHERTLE